MSTSVSSSSSSPTRASNLAAAGLRGSVSNGRVYRALADAIIAQFDADAWQRLADDLDAKAVIIEQHRRLLRSLNWSDPDYPICVREVVESILGDDLEGLEVLARASRLVIWLRANDSDRAADLLLASDGVAPSPALADPELTTPGVRAQIRRLMESEPSQHPDEVIGKAKNTIEATAKCVLHRLRPDAAAPSDFPALVSAAFAALDLEPKSPPGPAETHESTRQLLQGLRSAAIALGPLRNAAGDGHGPLDPLDAAELIDVAALAKDTSVMVANLLIHALERRRT